MSEIDKIRNNVFMGTIKDLFNHPLRFIRKLTTIREEAKRDMAIVGELQKLEKTLFTNILEEINKKYPVDDELPKDKAYKKFHISVAESYYDIIIKKINKTIFEDLGNIDDFGSFDDCIDKEGFLNWVNIYILNYSNVYDKLIDYSNTSLNKCQDDVMKKYYIEIAYAFDTIVRTFQDQSFNYLEEKIKEETINQNEYKKIRKEMIENAKSLPTTLHGPNNMYKDIYVFSFIVAMIIIPFVAFVYLSGFAVAFICTFFDPEIYNLKAKLPRFAKVLEKTALSWFYVVMYLVYYRKNYIRDRDYRRRNKK